MAENPEAMKELRPPLWKVPKCNAYTARFLIRLFVCELLGVANISFTLTLLSTLGPLDLSGICMVSIAYGLSVWFCGPISGPQIHTGLSLVMLLTRRIAYPYVIVGIVAQLAGGIIGCEAAILMAGKHPNATQHYGVTMIPASSTIGRALGMEIIGVFILILLVECTLDEFRQNAWATGHVSVFTIVFTMAVIKVATLVAPFSGVGLNPALTFGAAIVNNYYKDQWVFVVGPIVGSLLACIVYDVFLSNAASVDRLRAWFTSNKFDRERNYPLAQEIGKNDCQPKGLKCLKISPLELYFYYYIWASNPLN